VAVSKAGYDTAAVEERLEVPNQMGSTELDIPNFAFDFGKIASRASTLFPFLTDG
jgi:hypothetical protein